MLKIRSCATQARPTPPGPEGSNGKRILECAAGKPGWSRLLEIPQKTGIEGGCTEIPPLGGISSWCTVHVFVGRGNKRVLMVFEFRFMRIIHMDYRKRINCCYVLEQHAINFEIPLSPLFQRGRPIFPSLKKRS
jgi:hypothetical protein